LNNKKRPGPTCQSRASWPKHCRGHWPRAPPRAPYPFARDCSGKAPSHVDSSSCHLAAPTPLPPTVFLSREDLPGASPRRPTPGLVFTCPSTTVPCGTSSASPSSPMSAPPTPHWSPTFRRAHRRREPTPVSLPPSKTPNWVPLLSGMFPGNFFSGPGCRPAGFNGKPPTPRGGGGETPLSRPRAERPRGLGHHGRTGLWPNGLSPFQQ
jgi:hypothetical protein